MYQSKISSKMTINHKTGKTRLEEFDVDVDGYKNRKKLKKAKDSYDSDEENMCDDENDDWPKGVWNSITKDYYKRLKHWKKN